jgi:hypothetical protein
VFHRVLNAPVPVAPDDLTVNAKHVPKAMTKEGRLDAIEDHHDACAGRLRSQCPHHRNSDWSAPSMIKTRTPLFRAVSGRPVRETDSTP